MNRILTLLSVTLLLAVSATAQKIERPKLIGQEPTPAQVALIRDGVALHDAKKYKEAIAKYEQVLQENPACTYARYELTLSLDANAEKAKAEAVARKGTQYKSAELPLFYMSIANDLDDAGKADEAIELYTSAIKILKEDKDLHRYLARINYNLAVTYYRQKKYTEMKPVLKEALQTDFAHASAHLLIAELFRGTGYKVPALFAVTRFLGLERDTDRSRRAALIFLDILKPVRKDAKTGNYNIVLSMDSPKDEGDFGPHELMLGMTMVPTEEDAGKSENQVYSEGVDALFVITGEGDDLRKFFVGQTYVPYLRAMTLAGHTEAFAYVVLQQGGNADADKWVSDHAEKVEAYFHWAKEYRVPVK